MREEKIKEVQHDKGSQSVLLAGAGASISLDSAFMSYLQCMTHFLQQLGFDFSSIPQPMQPVITAPTGRLGLKCWRILSPFLPVQHP